MIRRVVLFTALAMLPLTLMAEQHRNQLKGFTPEGVFQFLGLDNVNIFSGNLVLTIPIGPRYPIAEGLSYGLQLVCNGNVWDSEVAEGTCHPKAGGDDVNCTPISAIPDRRANAGLGCLISLGRLYPPQHVTTSEATASWVYESPDGAEHPFREAVPGNPNSTAYTQDGSYLRMQVQGQQRWIEFPDGAIHKFEPSGSGISDVWRLVEITNQYPANYLRLAYPNGDLTWELRDSHGREHRVELAASGADEFQPMVETVELEAGVLDPGVTADTSVNGERVRFTLSYSDPNEKIAVPYWDTDDDGRIGSNDEIAVPLLERLNLPDDTRYEFDHAGDWRIGTNGLLSRLRLPTQGCIGWQWGVYSKPSAPGDQPHLQGSHGIVRRILSSRECPEPSDVTQKGLGVWTYKPELKPEAPDSPPCDPPPPGELSRECDSERQMSNRVTDPVGNYVIHYFSVAPHSVEGWREEEYGAPYTRYGQDSENRFLSQEVFECPTFLGKCDPNSTAEGRLLRQQFVRYESDAGLPIFWTKGEPFNANTRPVSFRMFYADDDGRSVDTDHDKFDGFGHYRETVQSGFSPSDPVRKTTTKYNWTGSLDSIRALSDGDSWILNTFDESVIEESGQATETSEYQFDGSGVLSARRVFKGLSRGTEDVLTVFERDQNGNVIAEKVYGGDGAGLDTASCCIVPDGDPHSFVKYSYTAGVLSRADYVDPQACDSSNCPSVLSIANYTIDPETGRVLRSRDVSDIETEYSYDALFRLKSVKRPTANGKLNTVYEYIPAGSNQQAYVTETVTASSGDELNKSTFDFDDLGRLERTSRLLPHGKFAVTQIEYDLLGRQRRVSQPIEADDHPTKPISGGYWTKFEYDALGRQSVVTAPDGSTTLFGYSGARVRTRGGYVATSMGDSTFEKTTEHYDGHGRLVRIDENAAATSAQQPTGGPVSTFYTYDAGGRLATVSMNGGTTTQERRFQYDGRGFLEFEEHPESGRTDYQLYDGRGYAAQRTSGGRTLRFIYDAAGRVTTVTKADGSLLKKFSFVSGNGPKGSKGKLEKATRRNDLSSAGQIDVTESYEYSASTGLMSARTSLVEKVVGTTRTELQRFSYGIAEYDDLLLPRKLTMPTCTTSGCNAPGMIPSVDFERSAGSLTEVKGLGKLAYHQSGMVKTVTHSSQPSSNDTYSTRYDMPRPSRITFGGCGETTPRFLPGALIVKPIATTESCGLQVEWPAAVVCGSTSGVRYQILRDGIEIAKCFTGTKYLDRSAVPQTYHVYTVVAEGAPAGGDGSCNAGRTVSQVSPAVRLHTCLPETWLTVDHVDASVGVSEIFRARLGSANGPLQGEELIFKLFGEEIGRDLTDSAGVAVLPHVVDVKPGEYPGGIEVEYEGASIPADMKVANLTAACDDDSFAVRPTALNFDSSGGSSLVVVATSSNCEWQPEILSGFFLHLERSGEQELLPVYGTGAFTLRAFALSGTSSEVTRKGSVKVAGRVIQVNQSSSCTYRFEPELAIVPAGTDDSTPTTMGVVAPVGCPWAVSVNAVSGNADWVRLSEWQGTGPGTIRFTTDANTGAARFARLTFNGVAGAPVGHVNQYGPGPCTPPEIIQDIRSGTVSNDQDIVMRVAMAGSRPMKFRWFFEGLPLTSLGVGDAFATRLIRSNEAQYPSPGNSYSYMVLIENDCGSALSGAAQWTNLGETGCAVPRITSQPESQNSAFPNQSVGLQVSATHANGLTEPPLAYQWYHGTPGDRAAKVSVGTARILFVSPGETSHYWVEVSDACGSQDSVGVTVYVTPPKKRRGTRSDFNGDGKTDLVWHNKATAQNEIWAMSGTTRIGTLAVVSSPDLEAQPQSIGDLNGDGQADLLWRNPVTGSNEAWIMSGRHLSSVEPLESRPEPGWTIGAVADLDGDEHHDVVWHHETTGANEIWFQNGTEHSGTWALPSSPEGSWGLHGTGDFNGDEKPDLFFHDRSTGANSVWLMNDAARAGVTSNSSGGVSRRRIGVSVQPMATMPSLDWVPALIADMNGDEKPDVVWRNTVTGENSVWIMNGTTVTQTVVLETRSDLNWQVGGGGSTNSSSTPPEDPRIPTALEANAGTATAGTASVVTATLTAAAAPIADRLLIFSVGGAEVSRLLTDEDGTVTAGVSLGSLPPGTHENAVEVRFEGDSAYAPASASTHLTVVPALPIVTWESPGSISYGSPLGASQLNASANVPGSFSYDPQSGTVLAAGYHTLRTTFTPTDPGAGPVNKQVVLLVTKAAASLSWVQPAPISYGMPLHGEQLNAFSTVPGTFTYEPSPGTTLDVGLNQSLTASFLPDDANYDAGTVMTTIDVGKGTQAIRWPDPAVVYVGDPLGPGQLGATVVASGAAPPGAITFDPPAGTMLEAGIHEVTAVVPETSHYESAAMTVDVVVVRSVPVLHWERPAAIIFGVPLSAVQLNATADVPGTFAYTPPAGTVLKAGTATLTASFQPQESRYESATASVTIDVAKATPIIEWSSPAPIVYGTVLDDALQATADVPGLFTYDPEPGSILSAGNAQILRAVFTPLDTVNYEVVTATVLIDVVKAAQTIVWDAPAPITYGTPLSANQINARVEVGGPSPAGSLIYTPVLGTVLNAGLGQPLSVTAAETANYEPATASVTIDVLPAPLSLIVHAKQKLYGAPLPALTGVLTGVVNDDRITASYATDVTTESATGVYSISGTLQDPDLRLSNYQVTITPASLTVLPAQLLIAATPASKQYSDSVPELTASFSGLVLGETPAALSGSLVVVTEASRLSGPGTYPITLGGLTSANYVITYMPSVLTVTPEDARVVVISPTAASIAPTGATSVTMVATVQDISATDDAAGDSEPGDIREATMTFVDRSTNTVLCTAPIGLVAEGDERVGLAMCTFSRTFAQVPDSMVVGTRIGGSYLRDSDQDDQTVTVGAGSGGSITGGGGLLVESSAGTHRPDPGSDARFTLNLKPEKNGAIKGDLTFKFERLETDRIHEYELTVAAVRSLRFVADGDVQRAAIVGTGVLLDMTQRSAPVILDPAAPVIVTATDGGEPSTSDAMSVLVLKSNGGVWLASGWSGVRAVEQPVVNGNITVHEKK